MRGLNSFVLIHFYTENTYTQNLCLLGGDVRVYVCACVCQLLNHNNNNKNTTTKNKKNGDARVYQSAWMCLSIS
jgi:hypothetical protein